MVSFRRVTPWSRCRSHKKAAVWEWTERRGGGVIWRGMNFLRSREDPRTGSGGCRGALCSRSGRRRWRDRRCTWAEDDCQSDSEDAERDRSGQPDVREFCHYWSLTVYQLTSVLFLFAALICGCVIGLREVTANQTCSGGKTAAPRLNIFTQIFFHSCCRLGDINAFPLSQPTPSGQNLASRGSTSPLSKISPGHFPPYRKRQEMTLLDLAVRQHFLQSLPRGSEVCEKVDWERLGPWDKFTVVWVCVYMDSCIFSLSTLPNTSLRIDASRAVTDWFHWDADKVHTAIGKVPSDISTHEIRPY